MTGLIGNFEKIKGVVSCIYEDFDTLESIVKDRAVAFGLDVTCDNGNEESCGSGGNHDNGRRVVVIYDKNALKLGMIKVGEPLICLGKYSGEVAAVDSKGDVVEEKMFLCMGIMGDADINEEELIRQGAIRLR